MKPIYCVEVTNDTFSQLVQRSKMDFAMLRCYGFFHCLCAHRGNWCTTAGICLSAYWFVGWRRIDEVWVVVLFHSRQNSLSANCFKSLLQAPILKIRLSVFTSGCERKLHTVNALVKQTITFEGQVEISL